MMKIPSNSVVLDWETYWANDYTLSRMSPRAYVNDTRFEPILLSMKVSGQEPNFYTDPQIIGMMLKTIDWENTALIGHNLPFDGRILSDRYDIAPAMYIDTMAMARARIKPFTGSVSLDRSYEYLKARMDPAKLSRNPLRANGAAHSTIAKGDMALRSKGFRRHQMPEPFLHAYGLYGVDDVLMTLDLAKWLIPQFSSDELWLIDRSIRMDLFPMFRLNADILTKHHDEVVREKIHLLNKTGLDKGELMSNEKFADVLRSLGVDPPKKTSPTTGKETYAFAKKDLEFVALMEHEDPKVQAVVSARMGVKSTIAETRAAKFLSMALEGDGRLPIVLNYAGAHSLRFSGGGGNNLQNIPSGSPIRHAMEAPPGYRVVVADARQIEARVLAVVGRQRNKVQQFRDGIDVYSKTAEGLYGRPIDPNVDKLERKVGKVADLQLGYAASAGSLYQQAVLAGVPIDMPEAERVTKAWRLLNSSIAETWDDLFDIFKHVATAKRDVTHDFRGAALIGYSTLEKAAYFEAPNGNRIWYPSPGYGKNKLGRDGFGYEQRERNSTNFIVFWRGLVINNLIQFLARCLTMEHAVRLTDYPVMKMALTVHDELVFIVPETAVDKVIRACEVVMSTPPAWGKDYPLAAEVKSGRSYGEAK